MEMLAALGINSTVWVQLVLYVIAYLALSNLIFKPYLKAYQTRMKRADASSDVEDLHGQTGELQHKLDTVKRDLHAKTRDLHDSARAEAGKLSAQIAADSRNQAAAIIESARKKIESELSAARAEINKEAPALAKTIAAKLIGREL